MNEFTTVLYHKGATKIVRVAIYHPSVPHKPFHMRFDVWFGSKLSGQYESLKQAMFEADIPELLLG
jgi:hypothetical protein